MSNLLARNKIMQVKIDELNKLAMDRKFDISLE